MGHHQSRVSSAGGDVPPGGRVLVVVAHPDDESFALGALISRFVDQGAEVSVLCLTRGEASTLGGELEDLASVRGEELRAAAAELGIGRTLLLGHSDGGLSEVGTAIEEAVGDEIALWHPDGLLVMDPRDGVTGHPDHAAASLAALAVARRHQIPVLGWALPLEVSSTLSAEFGASFGGHPAEDLTAVVVDRGRQLRAVRHHATQAVPSSVLWRRLELVGDRDHVRGL